MTSHAKQVSFFLGEALRPFRDGLKNFNESFSYELVGQIGRGNFACVWKAYHKLSPGIHVAIKVIDKSQRCGRNPV